MSVNTSVYGGSSSWLPIGNTGDWSAVTDKEKIKVAYFGAGNWYDQTLSLGNTANKTPLGQPIDKSLSYCGLGTESALSHIKYFDKKAVKSGTVGRSITPFHTDNRQVTNFTFAYYHGGMGSSAGQPGGHFVFSNSQVVGISGEEYRWAPNTGSIGYYQLSAPVIPVTSFKFTNFILYIQVGAFDGTFNSDGDVNNPVVTSLYDYEHDVDSVRTNHPYIYCVSVVPYCHTTSSVTRMTPNSGQNCTGIVILDSYDGAMDSPLSASVYSYYYSMNNNYNFKVHGMWTGGYNTMSKQYNPSVSDADKSVGYLGCFPDTWTTAKTLDSDGYICMQAYRPWDETFYDETMEAVACFGCFFTEKASVAQTGSLLDPDMCCGTLEAGIGHGKYTRGPQNENQPQYKADTNETGYDPNSSHSDPNAYNGTMRTGDLRNITTPTKKYNVSYSNISGLLDKLWDVLALADQDEKKDMMGYSTSKFLASNPIDAIVSLQYLPVKNMASYDQSNETTIKLGTFDTQIAAYNAKTSIRFNCGNKEVYPRFQNSWIDRQTKITLYLPFCGTINLDPETYMGRTINVEYLIDLTTGLCSAAVSFASDYGGQGGTRYVISDVANGCCAIDLPVTGIQQQTLNSQLFNASEATKQLKVNNAFNATKTIINGVASLKGSSYVQAFNTGWSAAQSIWNMYENAKIADYNLEHTMIPTKMIGASSGLSGAMLELYPSIIFERPRYSDNFDEAIYAHSIGYACCICGTIKDYGGYAEWTNVDLSGFDATATEKDLIRSALLGGVYV